MKYLLSLCLLLLYGCATNEEKTEPKKYSDETNRAFEMIERGGSYYLKKAPENAATAPQIKTPANKTQTRPAPKYNEDEQETAVQQPSPVPHVKRNTTKMDERLIEINQNLAFYCMKHRKDPRYGGDEAKCMNFVNKTMANCQKVHRIVNSKLLNCIQTKLRKK